MISLIYVYETEIPQTPEYGMKVMDMTKSIAEKFEEVAKK